MHQAIDHHRRHAARRAALPALVLLATVGCDRATKLAAEGWLPGCGRLSLLGDSIRIELVRNAGAFLGLGAELPRPARVALFVFGAGAMVSALALAALGRWRTSPGQALALALLAGGGLGNLWDRLLRGTVTDFLQLGLGPLRTGIFNLADLAIVAGVLWLARPRRRAGALASSPGPPTSPTPPAPG